MTIRERLKEKNMSIYRLAKASYALAVNRSYKWEGEPDTDFINITAFGKRGEFSSKYFHDGRRRWRAAYLFLR